LESTRQATARLVDAYLDCGRFPVTLFPAAYARLARNHARLWAALYHGSNTSLDPTRVLRPFLRAGFRTLMTLERPDLVVSVVPVVNGVLVEATEAAHARLEVVLTDWHSVHRFWVAPGVDHYTAPTDSARKDCIRFGAPAAKVDVVGIPVRRAFSAHVGRHSEPTRDLSELGLNPGKFTILAMVGAEGSPRALRNIAQLAQLELDAQLVVVCGRNDVLRQRVQRLPARMPLHALGFVEKVAELMRGADVLVTKAGGLTLAEAFCSRVPVVVHDVLPGQEAGNLEYVLRQGAVRYAPHPSALTRVVSELIAHPMERRALAERGAALARPDAAQRIVRGMLARLGD
jgi:UDP-N-acetylglucosamine:LPS N-acetylglucosamine transferase